MKVMDDDGVSITIVSLQSTGTVTSKFKCAGVVLWMDGSPLVMERTKVVFCRLGVLET